MVFLPSFLTTPAKENPLLSFCGNRKWTSEVPHAYRTCETTVSGITNQFGKAILTDQVKLHDCTHQNSSEAFERRLTYENIRTRLRDSGMLPRAKITADARGCFSFTSQIELFVLKNLLVFRYVNVFLGEINNPWILVMNTA